MALITNTEADVVIPEVWRPIILDGLYASQKVVPRVLNATENVKGHGDIIHIPYIGALAVSAVSTTTGALTDVTTGPSEVQLTVNKWQGTSVTILDKSDMQSIVDLIPFYSKQIGKALGEDIDSSLLALYSEATYVVGDSANPSEMTDGYALSSMVLLDEQKVPEENRTWILSPSAKSDLLKLDKFTTAEKTGLTKGVQINGGWGELYGISVVITPLVKTTGSAKCNLLIQENALAVAIQKNFSIEQFARTAFATPVAGSILYGVKTVRSDHEVVIYTSKAA